MPSMVRALAAMAAAADGEALAIPIRATPELPSVAAAEGEMQAGITELDVPMRAIPSVASALEAQAVMQEAIGHTLWDMVKAVADIGSVLGAQDALRIRLDAMGGLQVPLSVDEETALTKLASIRAAVSALPDIPQVLDIPRVIEQLGALQVAADHVLDNLGDSSNRELSEMVSLMSSEI